jgi:hypothetical protein
MSKSYILTFKLIILKLKLEKYHKKIKRRVKFLKLIVKQNFKKKVYNTKKKEICNIIIHKKSTNKIKLLIGMLN